MFLFESNAPHWSMRAGHDAAARFMSDVATKGVPMTLASVKAASDAIVDERKAGRRVKERAARAESLPLVRSIGSVAGLS